MVHDIAVRLGISDDEAQEAIRAGWRAMRIPRTVSA
jgi:hypothetical protein